MTDLRFISQDIFTSNSNMKLLPSINVNNKNCALKLVFFNEKKKLRKIWKGNKNTTHKAIVSCMSNELVSKGSLRPKGLISL